MTGIDGLVVVVIVVAVGRSFGCKMMMMRMDWYPGMTLCSHWNCRCSCPSLDCLGRCRDCFGFG